MRRRNRSHLEEWASLLDSDVPDDLVDGDSRRDRWAEQ